MNRKHIFFYRLLRLPVAIFLRLKFGYRYHKAKNLPENYIVLSNHNTDFDPLFVAVSFSRQMYFVASEHIARWKNAYKFLKFAFEPIVRYKGTTASATVMDVLRKLRKGERVCMFAEGARSWNGVTAPILPSTGKVVKSAGCALVTYRIEGGYFVSPNWSQNGTRKGRIRGGVVNVYTAEQLSQMSVKEVNAAIAADLYEDACERQLRSPAKYTGKQLAYRMENMLFYCPHCRTMDSLTSAGDTVFCSACGKSLRYDEYGRLHSTQHQTMRQLFAWLVGEVGKDAEKREAYTSENGRLLTIRNHVETQLAQGEVRLDATALRCGEVSFELTDICDMAMHGRKALVFSTENAYYELLSGTDAGMLKFHLLYQFYKNGRVDQYQL